MRVPLVVSGPGVAKGNVVGGPVSLLDLAPTLCEVVGADAGGMHGASLVPQMQRRSDGRDYVYGEWDLDETRCGVSLKLRTIRTSRHKMTVDLLSGAGELYDLAEDPDEMNNLFDAADIGAARNAMLALIAERPDDERAEPLPRVGMA